MLWKYYFEDTYACIFLCLKKREKPPLIDGFSMVYKSVSVE